MVNKISAPFFINSVEDHMRHKEILLNFIDKFPENPFERISKTDWNLHRDGDSGYLDYFHNFVVRDAMCDVQRHLQSSSWEIGSAFFQQYEEKSEHNWHNHNGCNFTNCYFLELPSEVYKTEILDPITRRSLDYEAKEGDIITFPAYMIHRSKSNGDGRKTTIAFNSDFKY